MAHNVLGIRRFGQVIGQCEALTPAQNVATKKCTKGVARLHFFVARAANGGEAYTVCYVKYGRTPLYLYLIIQYSNSQMY